MIQKLFILNGRRQNAAHKPMSGLDPDAIDEG